MKTLKCLKQPYKIIAGAILAYIIIKVYVVKK